MAPHIIEVIGWSESNGIQWNEIKLSASHAVMNTTIQQLYWLKSMKGMKWLNDWRQCIPFQLQVNKNGVNGMNVFIPNIALIECKEVNIITVNRLHRN